MASKQKDVVLSSFCVIIIIIISDTKDLASFEAKTLVYQTNCLYRTNDDLYHTFAYMSRMVKVNT